MEEEEEEEETALETAGGVNCPLLSDPVLSLAGDNFFLIPPYYRLSVNPWFLTTPLLQPPLQHGR